MHINEKTRAVVEWALSFSNWPDAYFDIGESTFFVDDEAFTRPQVSIQAATQEEVRRVRATFPGVIWKKSGPGEDCSPQGWWEYDGIARVDGNTRLPFGVKIHIYACYEGPTQCKRIVEEVEVDEKVPVAFETRKVRKTRVRWECPEETTEVSA